jgi:hypothetical protein
MIPRHSLQISLVLLLWISLPLSIFAQTLSENFSGSNPAVSAPTPEASPVSEGIATTAESPARISGADQPIPESPGRQMYPYYFSAYILPQDQTEVDLGMILSAEPGIEVALGWSVVEDLMVGAKMTVAGASNSVGLAARYQLRPETAAETKPAISLLAEARFVNQRTGGDVQENIFRGSRLLTGVAFSKDLGSLATSLEADPALQSFLKHFRIHAQALVEYQTGLEFVTEAPVSRVELGTRAAMEAEVEPRRLYLSLGYDSLPDRIGRDNYYLGLRYFSHADFAIDGQIGRIGNDLGALVAMGWIF